MGTNFYLATKVKELKERYFGNDYVLTDTPDWGYEIHIAKTSMGWKPLFQAHQNAFRSVAELKALYEAGGFVIYDEYREFYNWDEFEKRVVKFNEKPYKSPNGEDLPLSHFDERITGGHLKESDYFKDDQGYEFTWHEFC